jgi:hypothetical protein
MTPARVEHLAYEVQMLGYLPSELVGRLAGDSKKEGGRSDALCGGKTK